MWAFVDSSWYFYNLFYLVIILKLYPTDDSQIFFIQVLNYKNNNEFSIWYYRSNWFISLIHHILPRSVRATVHVLKI